MKYTTIQNPRWANPEHTLINCEVLFAHLGELVPFTASPNDSATHGVEIYNRCAAEEFGPVQEYEGG